MGATTAVMNIILGIAFLADAEFAQQLVHKPVKTVLVTAVSESGNCYSLILKHPTERI